MIVIFSVFSRTKLFLLCFSFIKRRQHACGYRRPLKFITYIMCTLTFPLQSVNISEGASSLQHYCVTQSINYYNLLFHLSHSFIKVIKNNLVLLKCNVFYSIEQSGLTLYLRGLQKHQILYRY